MHRSDIFPACQTTGTGGASGRRPNQGPSSNIRRRRWDKTSEVPAVHGALHWWALSKAVKPHFSKPYWRAPAPFRAPAASMPELPSATASPEARRHKMGVGLTAATTSFMGDSYTFIDCPGSVEFAHDMRAAIPAVDAAVVVCEADEKKLPQLQIILRELEDLGIPALSVSQQDRPRQQAHPRDARDPAAGVADSAGAAADSDLERRPDRRFRRPRAGTRLCLSRTQGLRSRGAGRRRSRPREGSPVLDAGKARRSRRRADGAIARGYSAAARCGVRRSRPRIARRPDLPGAARFGHARERRAAADEGAAP